MPLDDCLAAGGAVKQHDGDSLIRDHVSERGPRAKQPDAVITGDWTYQPLRVLVITATFPSSADPSFGVFVKERIKALAEIPGIDVRVIAPVPWFPPIKVNADWYRWSQFPRAETVDGLMTYRPRYVLPPKLGGYFHSELMFRTAYRQTKMVRREFNFDLIDSHFVYPGGVVAVKLAKRFGVPVTMTGRGEDMNRFPDLPIVGDRIRWALANSDYCIGVSQEIADAMLRNGSRPETTTVLGNGIDASKFFPSPRSGCRAALGLPDDRRIILTVGERIPRKGFDVLVQAMPGVLSEHPDALLVILGRPGRYGRDCTPHLEALIERHQLQHAVQIRPPCHQHELRQWYSASDLFALMSSSEGCPNVILEALACGVPCIATGVGSVPDDLCEPYLGRVLPDRTSRTAEAAIRDCLRRDWDSTKIGRHMQQRTWKHVANDFARILGSVRSHAGSQKVETSESS